MVGWLKDWVINICTAVFFIVAIEMILPNNSLKKYAQFVLGLILMIVVINPIIKFYNEGLNINSYADKATQYMEGKNQDNNIEKYREKNMETTLNNFQANLQNNCEKYLKDKYPKGNYKVSIDVMYHKEKGSFEIRSVRVGLKDNKIESVRKVQINANSSNVESYELVKDERGMGIINSLSEELKISKDIIVVYKM